MVELNAIRAHELIQSQIAPGLEQSSPVGQNFHVQQNWNLLPSQLHTQHSNEGPCMQQMD